MSMSMSGMDMDGTDMSSGSCSMSMLGNWETIGSCFLTSSWHISTAAQFAGTCIGVFMIVVVIESVRRWGREWDRYIVRKALEDHQRMSNLNRAGNRAGRRMQTTKACCRSDDAASVTSASSSEKVADQEEGIAQLNSTDAQSKGASASSASLSPAPRGADTISKLERAFFGLPARSAGGRALRADRPVPMFRPSVLQQAIRSLVYAIQFTGAYIVMLIAMSYNGYILISIVLGGLVGHFFSTWDTLSFTLDDSADDLHLFGEQLTSEHHNLSASEAGAKGHAQQEALTENITRRKHQVQELYGNGSGACCN